MRECWSPAANTPVAWPPLSSLGGQVRCTIHVTRGLWFDHRHYGRRGGVAAESPVTDAGVEICTEKAAATRAYLTVVSASAPVSKLSVFNCPMMSSSTFSPETLKLQGGSTKVDQSFSPVFLHTPNSTDLLTPRAQNGR